MTDAFFPCQWLDDPHGIVPAVSDNTGMPMLTMFRQENKFIWWCILHVGCIVHKVENYRYCYAEACPSFQTITYCFDCLQMLAGRDFSGTLRQFLILWISQSNYQTHSTVKSAHRVRQNGLRRSRVWLCDDKPKQVIRITYRAASRDGIQFPSGRRFLPDNIRW